MQNRQTGRRRRGGGGGQPRPLNQPMGGQAGNRLENRVRGNASQLLEKYKQLARDAHQAGDRVAAEYYLQHADHYFRVLNDARIRQEEMRVRRGVFDSMEEDGEEEFDLRRDSEADARPGPPVIGEANGHRPGRRPMPAAGDADGEALSDGEAALVAFGGAPPLTDRSDAEARVEAEGEQLEAEGPRPQRRRGRPRKNPSPAAPVEG
jgi:hypothetical protein